MKIVIIDYGMGNIKSITSALKYLGVAEIVLSHDSLEIETADKIILPGVGSFSEAMQNIKKFKLDKILKKVVIEDKKPILGICLGMQLMATSSTEDGLNEGLNFFSADVRKFDIVDLKVPHVGFNQVQSNENTRLYSGLESLSDFYFTHSFYMQSSSDINESICNYGLNFIASYELDNIAGVQFHPELSQTNGLKLLDNFIKNF